MAKKRNSSEKRAARLPTSSSKANARTAPIPPQTDFDIVLGLIDAARARAVAAVNTELIDVNWSIGEHISLKITKDGWGKGTVEALAAYIQHRKPGTTGFSASNLWRMRQFYEIYRAAPKLAPLVREVSWTNNLLILSRRKREEEREFYLRLCSREKWGKRELERQLAGALFERTVLSPATLSAPLRELHPDAAAILKDSYLLEFPGPSSQAHRSGLAARPG
jgi:predicted nuclease of restriction endonuclease-like (RecB) superfamily